MRRLVIILAGCWTICGWANAQMSANFGDVLEQQLTDMFGSAQTLALAVDAYRLGAGHWPESPEVLRGSMWFDAVARSYEKLRFEPLPDGGLAIHYRRSVATAGAPGEAEGTINLPAPSTMPWKPARVLPAPEARQAVAADELFIYVITDTHIAKYDRATGERQAISQPPARHLNSGFVREDKVYCAESNYPETPEHSRIMRLDPASMELSTFKDLGNYGGSLTWCVHHDEHWWCNFARYGKRNGETFLVKFDEQWNERGRWTYPAAMIEKLGDWSVSGGIWHEGALLTSGHSDPILFRLRLPERGKTLELIDTIAVPFFGQGFAIDPTTGGLLGINRAEREVILTVPATPTDPRD